MIAFNFLLGNAQATSETESCGDVASYSLWKSYVC